MPEGFDALCASAGENVQEFNTHDISNTLWAIAKTDAHMLEVFAALPLCVGGREGSGIQHAGDLLEALPSRAKRSKFEIGNKHVNMLCDLCVCYILTPR